MCPYCWFTSCALFPRSGLGPEVRRENTQSIPACWELSVWCNRSPGGLGAGASAPQLCSYISCWSTDLLKAKIESS